MISFMAVSCMKDDQYEGEPTIGDIVFTPGLGQITPDDAVTVTATVTNLQGIASVSVLYKVNGGSQQSALMTASGKTYTGIIPAQSDQSVVAFSINATGNNGLSATSPEKNYTVSAIPIEYGTVDQLRMNEVNTSDKYIEIYNPTNNPINISGIKFAKNSLDEYYSDASGNAVTPVDGTILDAKSYAVMGCKGADWSASSTTYIGTATNGVSGSKSLLTVLVDSENNPIDYFVNTANAEPAVGDVWDGAYEYSFSVAARIPDGTGEWHVVSVGTISATNGTDASGEVFTHKIDFGRKPSANISGVSYTPSSPTSDNEVTVTATVTNATSVVLKYTAGSASEKSVSMTNAAETDQYSATIPAQEKETAVTFHIEATGLNGSTTTSANQNYTVTAGEQIPEYDYTKLVLNELNGITKYVEIANTGDVDVDLKGCYLVKDDDASAGNFFTITASHIIMAGGYLVLYCSGYSGEGKDETGDLTSTGGLSAKKPLKVQLFDPKGDSLDVFQRTGTYEDKECSFSRVSDMTGGWYYATPTEGTTNGLSNGVIDANYTLVMNEIDPVAKKIELYNNTSETISLTGMKLFKDEGEEAVWTGADGLTIEAGKYLVLSSEDVVTTADEYTFHSGFSGKKSVCMKLVNADGAELDAFIRGPKGDAWGGTSLAEDKEHSFSRIGGATGVWAYAVPTIGEENGEKVAEIAFVK